MREIVIAVVLIASPLSALAQDTPAESEPPRGGDMQGLYWIKHGASLDPPMDVPPDRVVITIEGDAARTIYLAMPQMPQDRICGEDIEEEPTPAKVAGPWVCVGDETSGYECLMAIMLETGQGTEGYICD